MKESETARVFESLPLPQPSSASSCSFSALPLAADSPHKLAKDEGGCPCLLVATGPAAKTQTRVPLVLENLAVLFDLRCQVSSPSAATQTGTFTVLKCVAADLMVRSYFLSLLKGISAAIGRASDRAKVAAVIEDLVELFRSLANMPKKEIQGLWGELLLIHQAKDPITLASAWRCETSDRYDFNKGAERIEVKTTSQKPRQHHFSLEQLCPPRGARLVVASIIIQRSGAGLSVFDLLDAIRGKTAQQPQLHLRLIRQLHETLGNAWQSARNVRFDLEAAVESLRYFDGTQIPKVSSPLPEGVSQVSFVANLESIPPLSAKSFADLGALFRCLAVARKNC
jgi:Putative  PD-(D/E)XK family member, (DUF4420)